MKKNTIAKVSEQEMLQKLNIPDWRHMNKECIMEFASNMQALDPEVAKNALAQFPKFAELGTEVVGALKDCLDETCHSENDATKDAYDINAKLLDNLNTRLNKPFLLPGERKKIIEAMVEVSKNITEIHNQHSHSVVEGLKQVAAIAGGVALTAGTVLGAQIRKKL